MTNLFFISTEIFLSLSILFLLLIGLFKKNSEFKQHLLSIKKIYTDKKYLSLYHHNFFIKNKIKIKFINDPTDI